MTLDSIIQVAREVGFTIKVEDVDKFERFAALVASAEREACALLCEEDGLLWGQRYAAAIRARGEQEQPR